jgi:hypothetical protein
VYRFDCRSVALQVGRELDQQDAFNIIIMLSTY